MEDALVSFTVAKLAKEKGCDLILYGEGFTYELDNIIYWTNKMGGATGTKDTVPEIVCTQSLLQRWLREVHNIHVWCKYVEKGYEYFIGVDQSEGWFEYFEEALEAGLQEALKLINKENHD